MGSKQTKCCCCPECTVTTLCGCTLKRLCVTLTVDDNGCGGAYDHPCCCTGQLIEVFWDDYEEAFIGEFQCGNVVVDFKYFFDVDYDGTILFKLQSNALGHPEGRELIFKEKIDFECDINNDLGVAPLKTIAAVSLAALNLRCYNAHIETRSAFRLKPACCSTCKCLPECLFADLDVCGPGNPGFSHGILCWDDDEQAYKGHVTEGNGTAHDVIVQLRPRCLYDQTVLPNEDGGRRVVLLHPYDVDPYDPCELPTYGDCDTSSECVVVISIPDTNYHRWFTQSQVTAYGLSDKCDGFGKYGTLTVGPILDHTGYPDRDTTGFSLRDAPNEQIEEPTIDYLADCRTYSGAIGGVFPLPGHSIPLIDPEYTMPLLVKNCPRPGCTGCEDLWAMLTKNATLPASVSKPTPACCGYYWGFSSYNIWILVWCDGTRWKGKQYCRSGAGTGGSPFVYTLKGDITINVLSIPGTRPQLTTTLISCCDLCFPCSRCNFPANLHCVAVKNGVTIGTWILTGNGTPATVYCGGGTLTTFDYMSVQIDTQNCILTIECNAGNCGSNCFTNTPYTINSCDPLDITQTNVANGFLCAACGGGFGVPPITLHIFA